MAAWNGGMKNQAENDLDAKKRMYAEAGDETPEEFRDGTGPTFGPRVTFGGVMITLVVVAVVLALLIFKFNILNL